MPHRALHGNPGARSGAGQPVPPDVRAGDRALPGGPWHTFDPRNNAQGSGRALIAHGRDAAGAPLTLMFGPGVLSGFRGRAEEAAPG